MASGNPDNLFEAHKSLLRDALVKNAERIESTKQVIKKFEVGKDFLRELPLTLKKQVLVPVGSKGFLRGSIVHTNEFLHNIGCGYFVKRTSKQAVDVCDRMLSETNTFLNKLYEEQQWLSGQVDVPSKENAFNDQEAIEITEQFDEQAEENWRIKHRESVKRMKQAEAEARRNNTDDTDVFKILDELELQEDLEAAQASEVPEIVKELTNKTDDVFKLDELEKEEACGNTEAFKFFHELQEDFKAVQAEVPRRKEEIVKELELINTNKTLVQTEDDKAEENWQSKHGKSVKRMKQAEAEARRNNVYNVWYERDDFKILEELELQEDFEAAQASEVPEIVKELELTNKKIVRTEDELKIDELEKEEACGNTEVFKIFHELQENFKAAQAEVPRRKEEIVKELELINTNKTLVQTEDDVFKRLDELEKEEELLDELDKLTTDSEEENVSSSSTLSDEVFLKNFLSPIKSNDTKISNINNENGSNIKETTAIDRKDEEDKKNESEIDISKNLENKTKTSNHKEKKDLEILERLNENTNLYSLEKLTTIRFSDEVETKIFDSSQAVHEEVPVDTDSIEDDEPVTIDVRFSHSDVEVSYSSDPVSSQEITKPSDIYYMQYRLKSILKNKNRIMDEPQNTGEYATEMTHAPLKKKERVKDRSWVCYDTFPKNGNDDQDNSQVQVPPVTEVREKVEPDTAPIPSTSTNQPKKRRSRFSVSRALNTAIQDSC